VFVGQVNGGIGVGKSSLTGQFVSHMWTERYDPTIEDAFRKEVLVNGRECVLEMCLPPLTGTRADSVDSIQLALNNS
jgi:GTPase SAR1 family protein